MIRVILFAQLIFFISFGISYGELRKLAYEKGKVEGILTTTEGMSLEQLQNLKISES